jgi:ribonuclease Z
MNKQDKVPDTVVRAAAVTIDLQVLGKPGRDNALLVTVDSGQSQHRLLFDCGEGCLAEIPVAQIQAIEAVFFSHFHVDHIAGFDTLLRMNWSREGEPLRLFGPPGAIRVLHHRLRGYTWNLVAGSPGEWIVTEIGETQLRGSRFLASEGFETEHAQEDTIRAEVVYRGDCFKVRSHTLDHGTPCLAYAVDEDDRHNVDRDRMRELGLAPGPWLKAVKDPSVAAEESVGLGGTSHLVSELRSRLLTRSPGDSVAYVTDFFLAPNADDEDRLVQFLSGCRTMICENNYRDADAELARKNYHMTSSDVARLANRAGLGKLILFHVSDRYSQQEWREQLNEVRGQFQLAVFPTEWEIEPPAMG